MKRRLLAGLFLISVICFSNSSWAYVISRGKAGGDCSLIGTWDAKTATCTMNTDSILSDSNYSTFRNGAAVHLLVDSGVTLDGNGHKIVDPDRKLQAFGVSIYGRDVTVKNLTIENYYLGLQFGYFSATKNITITNNVIRYNYFGISGSAEESNISNNAINSNAVPFQMYISKTDFAGNNISNNSGNMYLLSISGIQNRFPDGFEADNRITDNMISFNNGGMQVYGANNTISGNTFLSNLYLLFNSPDMDRPNKIFHNNFIDNKNRVELMGYNIFNLTLPEGGNYWSDFDIPEEGCSDSNEDGICDMSKMIKDSFFDDLPWTKQNGWLAHSEQQN